MSYTPDPNNVNTPADSTAIGRANAEIRALKGRVGTVDSEYKAADEVIDTRITTEVEALEIADLSLADAITAESQARILHENNTENPHELTLAKLGFAIPNAATDNLAADSNQQLLLASVLPKIFDDILGFINKKMYHQGCIVHTMNNANPFDILGFGTWQRIGSRRHLVQRDVANTGSPYHAVNNAVGREQFTLAANDLPAHTHADNINFQDAGHSHTQGQGIGSSTRRTDSSTSADTSTTRGTLNNTFSSKTQTGNASLEKSGSVGNNTTQNNPVKIDPYAITTNIWIRTDDPENPGT